jgi:hypothetical protein
MMRDYFFYLIGFAVSCFALSGHAKAASTRAAADGAAKPQRPHLAPSNDWELPSFVAQNATAAESDLSLRGSKTPDVTAARAVSHMPARPTDPRLGSTPNSKHLQASLFASAAPKQPRLSEVNKPGVAHAAAQALTSVTLAAREDAFNLDRELPGRLARLTAYWASEGDYYTERHLASTGIRLHGGLCAVDPSIIPYGSVVVIPGVGQFLAADTGSAVVSRAAAREAGHNHAERSALVIDLFFEHRYQGEAFAAIGPKFASISWWTPSATARAARAARSVFADEDWNKIYSKQL